MLGFRRALAPTLLLLLGACQGSGSADTEAGTSGPTTTAGTSTTVGSGSTSGPGTGETGDTGGPTCEETSVCDDHRTVSRFVCPAAQWETEVCAAGSGCVGGECVLGRCSDACNLGVTDGTSTCELYDIASDTWVATDPAGSLFDRGREYGRWLYRDGLRHGGIGNAAYSDPPQYTTVTSLGGTGDSAIWTGTYLAAEALRLSTTGSAGARANVRALVQTLHTWWNIPGTPGMLARYARPSSLRNEPVSIGDITDCTRRPVHCDVDYDGETWDYVGHISRDQYQGVLLGFAMAYQALGPADEDIRALIREDVVEFMGELMRERTVPVRFTLGGNTTDLDVDMRFVVLSDAEMVDGRVEIVVDLNDLDGSDFWGFQEFYPNAGQLLGQLPGLGLFANVPRADSAVMLSSFFRVGMLVTDGVPGFESQFEGFRSYYYENSGDGGNVHDWIGIAGIWSYDGACGDSYFANNIVMEPMLNLMRLEDDPAVRDRFVAEVLEARMWPEYETTKNPWFSGIYMVGVETASPDPLVGAAIQLAQFPSPPRVHVPVDLTTDPRYLPHEPGCPDQTAHTGAVDVGERVVSDFIWQRHPWALFAGGNPAQTFPGVDYLAALWLLHERGAIDDDQPNRCTAWRR